MSVETESLAGRLAELVRSFSGRRVLVLGDLVADQFVYGEISRVSREAPVLILRHERTETVPGGAANCVANLASLGARASVVGGVGDDPTGRELVDKLCEAGVDCSGVVTVRGRPTTTKVRILAGQTHSTRQQVIRVDYEGPSEQDAATREAILDKLRHAVESADVFVVSDYNYGVASAEAAELVRTAASRHGVPALVDSRFRLEDFHGFTSATPNEDEVEQLTGLRVPDAATLETEGARLRERLGLESLLITRGPKGMLLLERGREPLRLEAVGAREAVDVTGAGDTVIATFSLALASGANPPEAARLANHAGGVVVMKRGTACATVEELLASIGQE